MFYIFVTTQDGETKSHTYNNQQAAVKRALGYMKKDCRKVKVVNAYTGVCVYSFTSAKQKWEEANNA